jgi:hypothetical protein
MTGPAQLPAPAPPSVRMLIRTTAIAIAVAAVILVTFVLPAEYGVDPLGTGRRLGLTELASPTIRPVEMASAPGAPLAPVQQGPLASYPAEFKFDVFEVTLGPYEYVEYKYELQQGASMLYSWTASAPVVHDFHGARTAGAAASGPAEESFDKSDRRQANGSLTAPFTGIHGWFWENPGGETIRIRLTSAGYYTSAVEIRSDHTRQSRPLRGIETLAPLPGGPGTGPAR